MLEFGTLLDPVKLGAALGGGAAALTGLAIVEVEVGKVIDAIEDELDVIEKNRFDVDGHIAARSFGQGNEAVALGQEHTRAHGAIVAHLNQTIADLMTFQEAIGEAKRLITVADEDAQTRIQTVLARTESLNLGWTGPDPALPAANVPAADGPTGNDGGDA